MTGKTGVYTRNPDMVFREIAGEMILVPITASADETDSIYVLNSTGAAIWELMDGSRGLDEIADLLSRQFQVSGAAALEDLEDFVREMLAAGAIRKS